MGGIQSQMSAKLQIIIWSEWILGVACESQNWKCLISSIKGYSLFKSF